MQISIVDLYSFTRKQLKHIYLYCEPFIFKFIRIITYYMMSEITSSDRLFEALNLQRHLSQEENPHKEANNSQLFKAGRGPKINFKTVYGGELMAQALVAAQATVEKNRKCSSLHCYFHLPSSTEKENIYQVTKIRDGRTFSHRWSRVIDAHVNDPYKKSIVFQLDCSFRSLDSNEGEKYTSEMPKVSPPEDCPPYMKFIAENPDIPEHVKLFVTYLSKTAPFEFRFERPRRALGLEFNETGISNVWVRLYKSHQPDAEKILNEYKEAILCYISDLFLLHAANRGGAKLATVLSLNHTMWFHNSHIPLSFDDWLLFHVKTENINGGIALVSGVIYQKDGTILANMVQQGIMKSAE